MSEFDFQLVRGIGFAVAFAAAVALQRSLPHGALAGHWRVNGALWLANSVLLGLVYGTWGWTVSRWAQAKGVGLFNVVDAPGWIVFPFSVLAFDLVSYAWHRANHRFTPLWRLHQAHHSDAAFTVSTALRFHPGELLLSIPLRACAVALLGAPVEAVVLFEVVFTLQNLIEHGDIRLPLAFERRLARLFVTPALHRRHHSHRRHELNTNYGTIFSLWDRAFGSFGASGSDRSFRIGLPGADADSGLAAVLALPFTRVLRGAPAAPDALRDEPREKA